MAHWISCNKWEEPNFARKRRNLEFNFYLWLTGFRVRNEKKAKKKIGMRKGLSRMVLYAHWNKWEEFIFNSRASQQYTYWFCVQAILIFIFKFMSVSKYTYWFRIDLVFFLTTNERLGPMRWSWASFFIQTRFDVPYRTVLARRRIQK